MTTGFTEHVMEQLDGLPGLACGRFFGGTGLKAHGTQFAMLMGTTLYFVVDDRTRPKYEKQGSGCFWYTTRKGRVDVRKYFEVPVNVLESRSGLLAWARESLLIAAAGASKPRKTATRKSAP